MYYVYRFIDAEGNIIYVGKSKQDLLSRFKGHQHLPDECYRQTLKIEYIECQTEADMSIKEIYYINKYRNTKAFWNIQDIATIPASVEFSDTWHMYMGELPKFFCNSINYIEGYSEKVEKEIRLTRNGEVDRRVCNKKEGVSSAVDALDVSEINRIINYLIDEIEKAEIPSQKQIRFRNLVMFVLGINLPLKINKFLELKYHHLLAEDNSIKPYELHLKRLYKDEIISIPLRSQVKRLFQLYIDTCNISYQNDGDKYLFVSQKKQVLSTYSCSRIIATAAEALSINRSIGGESFRKTYGFNLYQMADNKLEALVVLEHLFGQATYGQMIEYLGLLEDVRDYSYYLDDAFTVGEIDFEKLECVVEK